MASTNTGGTAVGLQALGGAAGLAGSLITSAQGKQDKRISGGEEDPAIAALRKRMAAQNAQTAMSVAASQQGVNPALAQRNAQQALAQQQVQTNANLAQNNVQSTLASRAATRGQQHQQIAGTALGLGQGLVGMGTSMGAQAAFDASAPGGAEGLSAPPAPAGPLGAGVSLQTQPAVATSTQDFGQPELDALQSADPMTRQSPALQQQMPGTLQMQGAAPQVMGGAPALQAAPAAGQPVAVPGLQESPMLAQPAPAAAPPQAAPPVPQASGTLEMRGNEPQVTAGAQAPAATAQPAMQTPALQEQPQEVALTTAQSVQALPPEVFNDPLNSGIAQMAADAEGRGNSDLAELLHRALLQRVSGGN